MVNIKMIKKKDLEYIIIKVGINMMVNGKMVKKKEKEQNMINMEK